MNILTSLLRQLGLKVKGASGDSWVPLVAGAESITTRNLLEANREWVFIAVHRNASSVSSVRFKVMKYTDSGDDQEVFDGPLVDFLEQPGEGLTGKRFAYLNTAYKELTGNAVWERDGKKIIPLVPTRLSPILTNGKLTGFKYADGASYRTIALSKIIHDLTIDPEKPQWGRGKLQRIARWVDTSSYVTEFLSRFFVNGASFGGFITTEEESQERIALIKAGLKNDHVGVANAHKIGVLPKGSEFTKVTASMAEMEMGETDDRYRDKILAAFGVPKSMVGLVTDVNRANAEAMEYVYAKYTVKPLADEFVEFLNSTIVPLFDTSKRLYVAYDDFVPVNMEIAIKERESALGKAPYKTINEVRAEIGLPPIKGGDKLPTPAAAPGSPVPAASGQGDEDQELEKAKKRIPRAFRAEARKDRFLDTLATKAVEAAKATVDPDAESHKNFVGRVDDHEKLIAGKIRDFNNKQENEVTHNLKQITKAAKKGDIFDMEREVGILVDFVAPMLKGLMLEQAVAEYADQGYPGTLDQAEPNISRVVELAARRLARSYNRTTVNLLVDTLNAGIAGGEDLTQLTARVKAVYEYSDQVRAAAVARTEAFYIANEGSREAFIQSGVVKTMRWYTADGEACEFCVPMNGKVVGVKEVFFPKGHVLRGESGKEIALDYRAIDVPPLHTNCRCFIRPVTIDIA